MSDDNKYPETRWHCEPDTMGNVPFIWNPSTGTHHDEEMLVDRGELCTVVLKFDDEIGNPIILCDAEVRSKSPQRKSTSAPNWELLGFGRRMNGESFLYWQDTWHMARGVCILTKSDSTTTWPMRLMLNPFGDMQNVKSWQVMCTRPLSVIKDSDEATEQ